MGNKNVSYIYEKRSFWSQNANLVHDFSH